MNAKDINFNRAFIGQVRLTISVSSNKVKIMYQILLFTGEARVQLL